MSNEKISSTIISVNYFVSTLNPTAIKKYVYFSHYINKKSLRALISKDLIVKNTICDENKDVGHIDIGLYTLQ